MSKEANPKEAVIKAAYADVNKFGENGEFDKAMKAVNRILGVDPNDPTALHCKIICLIQLSKFEEAAKFIDKNKLTTLIFEKAYCEYRLNKPENALKTIDEARLPTLPPNLKELRTQVLYRLERYEECFESYKEIIKNTNDDYEDERRTNLSAVAANLALDKYKEIPEMPEETYEQHFNGSFILSNREKYAEAEKKLKASEKLCRETLENDGASEDEVREELDIIHVQIAYCMQMQGKSKDSAAIYAEVLKNKPKDPALIAVASNNSVVINKDQHVFDSKKKIRLALADACEHKLTSRQKKAIALNNCLLALFTNASDQVQQFCTKLSYQYPDLIFQSLLIKASQLAKDKKHKEAVELLQKHASTTSDKDQAFATKFAIVQLLLLRGARKEAADVLLSLGESKYKPGVVSALVTLYLGLNNKPAASELLKTAVDWYKKNNVSSADLSDMWRQAAEFHLRGGATETAASSLEELLKLNPNDMKVLAQLVIAYAQFNPKKALEASKKLPKLETLTTASEIDALEAANWVMSTKAAKKSANAKIEPSPSTPVAERKKNRNRKGKLPKNYNAEIAPDPERWLPKYERTGFRKKRDRRAKDIIKGSQGMSTQAAEQYDMSNRANLGKNSPATPVYQEPTPGPRQQHRKGGQRKKKGGRF